jgi:hypothetical protein
VAAPPHRVDGNGVALLPAMSSAPEAGNPSRIFMPRYELRRRAPAAVLEYMQSSEFLPLLQQIWDRVDAGKSSLS